MQLNKLNMIDTTIKFENVLLLVIILLSFTFLGYAYYVTSDSTMRGVILGAVITALNTSINWRFGSSKSSQTKDEAIKTLQVAAANIPQTTIKTDTVNADNVDTVNTNTTNIN